MTGSSPTQRSAPHPPRLTLVIPTYNERDNIPELLSQLGQVLEAAEAEIIFVDDSTDDTPTVIEAARSDCPVPITVVHRDDASGGLGGAVVEGLKRAQGAWVVVMDADLQHPTATIADLVATGEQTGADLVVATRYAGGGDRSGLSSGYRKAVSGGSTLLAKTLFRRALAGVSDPMSGFFAVRAASIETDRLQPLGYKILLELIVRTRPQRVAEVPYTFAPRHAGESKSSLREGLRYLRHLATLRLGRTRARMLGYGLIGLSGMLPNLVSLWLLTHLLGVHYVPAAIAANQVAIAWNFALTNMLLFRSGPRRHSLRSRLTRFALLNNTDLLVRIPLLGVLVAVLHVNVLLGNALTLAVMFLVRFVVIDRAIFVPAPAETPSTVPETS
ncbi:glycosyltransferase [Micromonospora endophytica]|uniref:Dolichol-phosphate mannosyltransferase n=1 Tax=Micromonospora endophytica TaxID=515350 RepID=A0A2W2CDM1_9ACTN|nr:glycosyltransferase family 2 protein [Micromonospora endophytica]PZF97461.1 dolichol-phosphate mannosyltransferase [Micromonospora endophytica]RIW41356.1 glycosyltransferase family 2 protein [Micromonospora endophytica]